MCCCVRMNGEDAAECACAPACCSEGSTCRCCLLCAWAGLPDRLIGVLEHDVLTEPAVGAAVAADGSAER